MKIGAVVYSLVLACCIVQEPIVAAAETDRQSDKEFSGLADYYHQKLYGQKTASGEVLRKERLTAAHRSLPFGTRVKVTSKRTGKSCIVVINDRGPFVKGKIIDLSHAAAAQIGALNAGTVSVACTVLGDEDDDE